MAATLSNCSYFSYSLGVVQQMKGRFAEEALEHSKHSEVSHHTAGLALN